MLLTTDGTWQQLIRNKYLNSKPLSQAYWKPIDSHFWTGLMKVKQGFLCFGTFIIKMAPELDFGKTPGLAQLLCRPIPLSILHSVT
jgi:hypothetical protein